VSVERKRERERERTAWEVVEGGEEAINMLLKLP